MCYDGEDNDEKILFVIRRSHLTNFGWITIAVVMALIPFGANPFIMSLRYNGQPLVSGTFQFLINISWYLMIFGFVLFNYFNWFFNVYIISNKKVLDFDFYGLTYKSISETTLGNVEDVTAKINGPINMIFNIGDVFIQTAGETNEFDFESVDDPGKVRDVLADMVAEGRKGGHANN